MDHNHGLPSSLRHLFPDVGPALLRLYAGEAGQGGLLHNDFGTVRDLLDLSGQAGREPIHALLLALFLALNEGSLCLEVSEPALARRLADLVGEDEARGWARRILAELHDRGCPELVGRTAGDGRPVVLCRAGGRDLLYFQKHLKHETALWAALRPRLEGGRLVPLPGDLRAVLHDVLVAHPPRRDGRPVVLNAGQRLALALALLRDFTIISGGPGTGKSSLVFALLRCLLRCGIAPGRIALAAPTGRAAQRLGDALREGLAGLDDAAREAGPDAALQELSARTLHQLLRYQPSGGVFRHHTENPVPADVVVIDEASMVDVVLMARLLEAVAPGTRLVLLGDPDQLPSVEAGALLAHLVPADGRPRYGAGFLKQAALLLPDLGLPRPAGPHPLQDTLVLLEENYRSQAGIQEAARAVKRQEAAVVGRLPRFVPAGGAGPAGDSFAELTRRGGCRLLDLAVDDLAGWRRVLAGWAEHHYLSPMDGGAAYAELAVRCRDADPGTAAGVGLLDRLFAALDGARVLTALREGPYGSVGINGFLCRLLRPRLDGRGRGLFAGMPVLVTRNDQARGLFNGDVGVALPEGGGYRVLFRGPGGYVAVAADALPAWEPAFAQTVHKAQGGEYGAVLLVLPPEGGRGLLTKELVYTGLTRARQLALVAAPEAVLRTAVSHRIERDSGLRGLAV
jgi:exodeoxyribonuclease V alpha subunit